MISHACRPHLTNCPHPARQVQPSPNRGDQMTGTSTRPGRTAIPLARDSIRKIAESLGGCLWPIQMRRIDTATGQIEQVMKPCGATLASICRPCAAVTCHYSASPATRSSGRPACACLARTRMSGPHGTWCSPPAPADRSNLATWPGPPAHHHIVGPSPDPAARPAAYHRHAAQGPGRPAPGHNGGSWSLPHSGHDGDLHGSRQHQPTRGDRQAQRPVRNRFRLTVAVISAVTRAKPPGLEPKTWLVTWVGLPGLEPGTSSLSGKLACF